MGSVHVNFATDEEITDIAGPIRSNQTTKIKDKSNDKPTADYLRRVSMQYQWLNTNKSEEGRPYQSFEEFLSCFKSKRRIKVKREREKVKDEEGICIDVIVGKDILKYEGLVDRMHEIYLSTVQKMLTGRQYLTKEFFFLLANSSFIDNLCFLCARRVSSGEHFQADDVIAGTFNCIKNGVFYGRYWGSLEEVNSLHFEMCYYRPIEYCIKNEYRAMLPGAGGSDYKWNRGFDTPALVHSAHYIKDNDLRRAVCQFLNYETKAHIELRDFLMQNSVLGSTNHEDSTCRKEAGG